MGGGVSDKEKGSPGPLPVINNIPGSLVREA